MQGLYAFSKKLFPDFPRLFIYNMLVFSLTSPEKSCFSLTMINLNMKKYDYHIMALPKTAVFIKYVVQEEKETTF